MFLVGSLKLCVWQMTFLGFKPKNNDYKVAITYLHVLTVLKSDVAIFLNENAQYRCFLIII